MSMNVASTLTAAVNNVQLKINTVQTELASGVKTLDPAQQGVVTRLTSQATGFEAVGQNITQAKNVIAVAQTGLTSIATLITQMQKLANQAASGTVSDDDLVTLQATFSSLASQVGNIGTSAEVNGANLLADATGIAVQTGITSGDQTTVVGVSISDMATTLSALEIDGDAAAAITALQEALDSIGTSQSSLSASAVGLDSQATQAASLVMGLQSTIDSIQKVDSAAAQIQLTELNTQQSIDYYLINQMNTSTQAMLTLFR